jgi:hypothetical protein
MGFFDLKSIAYTVYSLRSANPLPKKTQQNQRPHYGEAFFYGST